MSISSKPLTTFEGVLAYLNRCVDLYRFEIRYYNRPSLTRFRSVDYVIGIVSYNPVPREHIVQLLPDGCTSLVWNQVLTVPFKERIVLPEFICNSETLMKG